MKINFTAQNFTGYKNIISHYMIGEDSDVAFITAQLTNDENKDLDTYKEIKKLQSLPNEAVENDIINLTLAKDKIEKETQIFLNEKPWLTGEELALLRDNVADKIPKGWYSNMQAMHMKGYTLFASLTRRMAKEENPIKDLDFAKVKSDCRRIITALSENPDVALDVMEEALERGEPFQKTAKMFNNFIKHTMNVLLG